MKPESLSSSSSMKSSLSSPTDSSSESVKALWLSSWTILVALAELDDDSSCSSLSSVGESLLESFSTETDVVSSHSRAGVEAWAWVRAGWCNTSSAQRAWGGDVQITLVGTTSESSSPDHLRLPFARGSPIVECPLFCSDISAHMMIKKSL